MRIEITYLEWRAELFPHKDDNVGEVIKQLNGYLVPGGYIFCVTPFIVYQV